MQKLTYHKNGSAILALLVAVLIIAMLYMIDFRAIFGPMDANRAYEDRPWFEEQRLLSKEAFPVKQTGKKGKVVIRDKTVLDGTVIRKADERGNIQIVVEPNGMVKGHWQCAYKYTDSNYTVTADFSGNIDPAKTYQDPKGKNKQLLYFIAKGNYQEVRTDEKTGNQWPTKAPIYAVGWIDKDFSAKGKLFLMANSDTDSHGNAEYDWQTKQNEPQNADKNK